jgi:hypothetical protein
MRGELDRADFALRDLLARQAGSGNDIEVVALAISRAELLHLNERVGAAMEQFEILIRPRLNRLDLPTRLAVEQNHIDLRTDPIEPDAAGAVSDFYHLYDRKQAAAVEWGENWGLLGMQRAARNAFLCEVDSQSGELYNHRRVAGGVESALLSPPLQFLPEFNSWTSPLDLANWEFKIA